MTSLYEPNALGVHTWPDHLIVAATIWGEARGERADGKVAVAWTIRHRARRPRWWGRDWRSVCLKPWQFSCWNENDPNRAKLADPTRWDKPEVWLECLAVAVVVMAGGVPDPVNGATHYHTRQIRPAWAAKLKQVAEVGNHLFYREE